MPEMQAPEQIKVQGPGDYLGIVSKVVFQSGMSYKIVESKWPGIREAFHGFDVVKVAGMRLSVLSARPVAISACCKATCWCPVLQLSQCLSTSLK